MTTTRERSLILRRRRLDAIKASPENRLLYRPVLPDDRNTFEEPTHDGYLNRICRDCGECLGCRKQEAVDG